MVLGVMLVTSVYNEAMDPEQDPTISFEPNVDTTLTFVSGTWSDGDTVYRATYNVADAGVEVLEINIDASGARHAASNREVNGFEPNTFSIDTLNPTVESITPSTTLVTVDDLGDAMFSIVGDIQRRVDVAQEVVRNLSELFLKQKSYILLAGLNSALRFAFRLALFPQFGRPLFPCLSQCLAHLPNLPFPLPVFVASRRNFLQLCGKAGGTTGPTRAAASPPSGNHAVQAQFEVKPVGQLGKHLGDDFSEVVRIFQ